MPTDINELDSNGTLAPWGDGIGGYYGQTFTAGGTSLSELQFMIAGHTQQTDYKIYITTWTGTNAGTILWESPLLVVGNLTSAQLVTVAIPNLALAEGVKYAFVIDTSVGPTNGTANVGSLAAQLQFNPDYDGGYAGGEYFYSPFETGTVAGNLARTPIIFTWADLAFRLSFGGFVNSAPLAADDGAFAVEDKSVSGNVLANDSDPDAGQSLVVTSVGSGNSAPGVALAGQYGTLTLNQDGSYNYAADADLLDTLGSAAGLQDIFTYQISDGQGGTGTAALTIDVSLADDARTITGTNKADTIHGDRSGLGGAEDTISGGNGEDALYGLGGADILYGGNGEDRLFGGGSRDRLYGENGNDLLDGGDGIDRLFGGQGNDRLTGGADADYFVFGKSGGNDIVTDFAAGFDRVVLDGVSLKSIKLADVDGNGVMDAVLLFSSGSATLLNVGNADLTGDIIPLASMPLI